MMLGRNVMLNSSFENSDFTTPGYYPVGGGVLSIETSTALVSGGTKSLKVVATGINQGFYNPRGQFVSEANQYWVASADVVGTAGRKVYILGWASNEDYASPASKAVKEHTFSGVMERIYSLPFTNSTPFRPGLGVQSSEASAQNFWVDQVQVEPDFDASPYAPHFSERVAGSMVTKDYQYEFNGLLMGAETDIVVERLQGLLGLPGTETQDFVYSGSHGASAGSQTMSKRLLDFDVHLLGRTRLQPNIESKLTWLRRAYQPQRIDRSRILRPLVFKRPGTPVQQLLVRCEKRDFASTYDVARGHAAGSIQLVAPDPVIYSYALKTKSLTIGASVNSGTLSTLHNAGDHEDGVKPVIEISGPCRDPIVTHVQSGKFIRFVGLDVSAGSTLIIDLTKKTALVGVVSKVALLGVDTQWFTLYPGDNSITYTRSSAALNGSASTVTVKYRDGWA